MDFDDIDVIDINDEQNENNHKSAFNESNHSSQSIKHKEDLNKSFEKIANDSIKSIGELKYESI